MLVLINIEKLNIRTRLKTSGTSHQFRAYNITHGYDIQDFLEAYRLLLQNAIDEIWANVRWVERCMNGRRRLIPILPKENSFRHHYLRDTLMNDWEYSKHYVDSAIKQAYSMLKSWRRSYLKGKRSREEADEGLDELVRAPRLMNPKGYVCLLKTT